jgi:NTE family protein
MDRPVDRGRADFYDRNMNTDAYCLVLSGGGTKGVFHIGAWRALREMEVPVEAVVGNSIGAIIAGFIAQGLNRELEKVGQKIGIDLVVKVPKDLLRDGDIQVSLRQWDEFKKFYRGVVSRKGLDTSPIRNLLEKHLDETKLRNSGIDLGVVAFNISDMKPREIFLDAMEPGKLIDYLLASSAFPGFEQPKIAGKKYIDGGVYNNIPYGMARERGYRRIIVIDVSGLGVNRRPDIQGSTTVYVKNSIKMGGVLDFDKDFLEKYTLLGYLDTMRAFNRFRGDLYFISPDHEFENTFQKILKSPAAKSIVSEFRSDASDDEFDVSETIRDLLPEEHRLNRVLLYPLLDCAASNFQLERIREYSVSELVDIIRERSAEDDRKIADIETDQNEKSQFIGWIEEITKTAHDIFAFKESPHFYFRLMDNVLAGSLPRMVLRKFQKYYPRVRAGALMTKLLTVSEDTGPNPDTAGTRPD